MTFLHQVCLMNPCEKMDQLKDDFSFPIIDTCESIEDFGLLYVEMENYINILIP